MKIAIPIYENRVMPRFGFTREIIVVTVEDGRVASTKRLVIAPEMIVSLPAMLAGEQVSVLICGGIHPRFQQALASQQIQLVWGVVGEWQRVAEAYLKGTLQSDPTFCLHNRNRRGSCLRRGRHGRT